MGATIRLTRGPCPRRRRIPVGSDVRYCLLVASLSARPGASGAASTLPVTTTLLLPRQRLRPRDVMHSAPFGIRHGHP